MWTLHNGACPPEANPAKCRPLVARGLRYERRVFRALRQLGLTTHIQPWLCNERGKLCQPDAVILFPERRCAVVVEVKLNWKRRRDHKLKKLYLQAVSEAFDLDYVYPLMVVSCCRSLERGQSLARNWLEGLKESLQWAPAGRTPVMLLP